MGNTVVKTQGFKNPRQVGDGVSTVRVFSSRKADELILLDIDASINSKEPNYSFVENVARFCFMPLTIGGGIAKYDHAAKLFDNGADKISIGAMLYDNPAEVEKIAKVFGSQAIVASIDCKFEMDNWFATKYSGTKITMDVCSAINMAEKQGAGELMITSVQDEGFMRGFSYSLYELATNNSSLPIIANGGGGTVEHFKVALETDIMAAAGSSIFFWEGATISDIKGTLIDSAIPITKF